MNKKLINVSPYTRILYNTVLIINNNLLTNCITEKFWCFVKIQYKSKSKSMVNMYGPDNIDKKKKNSDKL